MESINFDLTRRLGSVVASRPNPVNRNQLQTFATWRKFKRRRYLKFCAHNRRFFLCILQRSHVGRHATVGGAETGPRPRATKVKEARRVDAEVGRGDAAHWRAAVSDDTEAGGGQAATWRESHRHLWSNKVESLHVAIALTPNFLLHFAPKMFNSVSILFSDVVTFTEICSRITPMEVVSMLNAMYSIFDNLTERK